MSKKISAKALASLYPSNRWKTRSVINSAVSKVQQAYDEEFTRLQSIQQTYQSIMNFGKLATNAQLVEKAIRIVNDLGVSTLTPAETREKLKLKNYK